METGKTGETSKVPPRAAGEVVSAAATVNARRAVKAKHIVTLNRDQHELFAIARAWVGRLPDVEIVNQVDETIIAWKTAAGSRLKHAGSVNIRGAADGPAEVKIEIDYEPPGVAFGALFDDLTNSLVADR
jgi:hypothetical protein